MTTRPMTSVLLFAAGTLAGCHSSEAATANNQSTPRSFQVSTATVVERAVPRVIPLTGTLNADLRTDLTANASGRVVKTFVERGQRVALGATLAQLDIRSAAASASEAEAEIANSKTQLENAQAECARYDALIAHGAITRQEYDKQEASCREQFAALSVSKARARETVVTLADGTIRAPFAGVVTERFVSVGDYVQASSKVVTLVVSDPLRLALTVPERRISEVKEGALATFSPASLPDRTFSGTVKYLSGDVRSNTRDVVVEAIVANPEGALLPGMFVDVSLHAGDSPMAVIPKSAIFTTGPDSGLYVVTDKHLELHVVMLGAPCGDDVAIEEGVKVGDVVVTNPTPSMFDGAPVE